MMRRLLWTAAFLAIAGTANAAPERIRCVVSPTFICEPTGCHDRELERVVRVDFKAGTFRDCAMISGKLDCRTMNTTTVERELSIEGTIEAPGFVVRSFTFDRQTKSMIVTIGYSNLGWSESGFGRCTYE